MFIKIKKLIVFKDLIRGACYTPVSRLVILWACIIVALFSGQVKAELPRTGQISCYDQTGKVIDHTGTGQDGDLQVGTVWPLYRFNNNGDGTITDTLTGLMWLMDGGCLGKMSWQAAMEVGNNINSDAEGKKCTSLTATYEDWTLPEIWQLESLFNGQEAVVSDWLNYQGFSDVQSSGYWSGTSGLNLYSAWVFRLDSGETEQRKKVEYLPVLLVRQDKPEIQAKEVLEEPDLPLADKRFLDNGDGTVTDRVTGLMWLKDGYCFEETQWLDALDVIARFNDNPESFNCLDLTASHKDWALPNRHELRSLIDHQFDLPALPEDFPVSRVRPLYWTSTTVVSEPTSAYDIHMGLGDLHTTDKQKARGVWPVRPVVGRPERNRVQQQHPDAKVFSLLRPIGGFRNISWPPQRFTDQEDGTVIDNVTGLMWLKDAGCFVPENWKHTSVVINWLNTDPEKLARQCVEYSASYDDWQLPDLDTLQELARAAEKEPAAWLNSQGVAELKGRDYWTLTENPVNLYYAWAVNLRQGTPRNYSKSFVLNLWPFRRPAVSGVIDPKPIIRVNGETGSLALELGTEFILSVAVENVKGLVPADFRIWYEAPDGTVRWLKSNGQWDEKGRVLYEAPDGTVRWLKSKRQWEEEKDEVLYHGYIFKLDDYTVFRANTVGLKTGNYTFHFFITPTQEEGGASASYSAVFDLTLEDSVVSEIIEENGTFEIKEEVISQ